MFAHASPYSRIPEAFSSTCSPALSDKDVSFQERRIGAGILASHGLFAFREERTPIKLKSTIKTGQMARLFPTGVLPNLFPVWYSLCRMGIAIIAVLIATWMARIYWYHGVWAMGKKEKNFNTEQNEQYISCIELEC
jgi:hypothetical protein